MDLTDRENGPNRVNGLNRVNSPNRANAPVLFREVQKMNQIGSGSLLQFLPFMVWGLPATLTRKAFRRQSCSWLDNASFIFRIRDSFPSFFLFNKAGYWSQEGRAICSFSSFLSFFETFPFETIRNYEIKTYNPIRDYGGWGIRYGSKVKTYTVAGNKGLLFEFIDGKKVNN